MLSIPTLVPDTTRRSVTGALATDPTVADKRQRPRRPARARRAPERGRAVRTPAPAPQR